MLVLRKIILALLIIAPLSPYCQSLNQNRLDSLSGALITQIRSDHSENLYLTTDKSLYLPGEPVWFRAFLENRESHRLSRDSRVVFLQLINQQDTVIKSLILESDLGLNQMTGKINLPEHLPGGYYWLTAYTTDMLRRHQGKPACEPIYVFNPDQHQRNYTGRAYSNNAADSPRVKFYPEGGTLITGAPSLLGLKITQNHIPQPDSGMVMDNRGEITGKFLTNQYGMAGLTFEPSHYKSYDALFARNGKTYHYPLPPFNPNAGQVSITSPGNGTIQVRVLLEDSLFNKEPQTCLVAICSDSLCFASIGNGNYQFGLPITKFPPGITTFFLFSNSMQLLSQRSIYVTTGISVDASLDPPSPGQIQKATLNIHIHGSDGQPLAASLSVSVVDDHFIRPLEQDGTYLSPWDLAQDSALSPQTRDLLMLTQEGRSSLLPQSSDSGQVINNDSLLYIQGSVTDKDGNPLSGKIVSVLTKEGNNFFQTDTTNAHGRFCFRLTGYSDPTSFDLRVLDIKKEKNGAHIEIDSQRLVAHPLPSFDKRMLVLQPRQIARFMDTSYFVQGRHVLAPVLINQPTSKVPDYDVTKRISRFSKIIDGSQLQHSGMDRLGDALLSVGGLKLLNGFLIFGGPTGFQGVDASSEPMIVVDGVNIMVSLDGTGTSPDLNYLNNLNTRSIDFIEILTGPEGATFGSRGGHGVIVVNTRNNAREDEGVYEKNNLLKKFQARGFYVPESYSNPPDENSKEKRWDVRSTLYWNGNVLTDKQGNATLSFQTNDVPGHYTIIIKGLTDQGIQIEKSVPFEIL